MLASVDAGTWRLGPSQCLLVPPTQGMAQVPGHEQGQGEGQGHGWSGSCPELENGFPGSGAGKGQLLEGCGLTATTPSHPRSTYSDNVYNDGDGDSAVGFFAREAAGQGSEKGCSPLGSPPVRPTASSGSTCTAAHRSPWEDTAGSGLGLPHHSRTTPFTPPAGYRIGKRPGMDEQYEATTPEGSISFHRTPICPGAPMKHRRTVSVDTTFLSCTIRLHFE